MRLNEKYSSQTHRFKLFPALVQRIERESKARIAVAQSVVETFQRIAFYKQCVQLVGVGSNLLDLACGNISHARVKSCVDTLLHSILHQTTELVATTYDIQIGLTRRGLRLVELNANAVHNFIQARDFRLEPMKVSSLLGDDGFELTFPFRIGHSI